MLFGTLISFACFFKSRPDRPERSQNAWSYKVILRFSAILQPKREPQLSHNSATTQPQLSWVVKHVFERLSCTFQGLSCTLQLTTTQSLLTFKKHYKTRTTQHNSLQLRASKKRRWVVAPRGRVNLGSTAWGRKPQFFESWTCRFDATVL